MRQVRAQYNSGVLRAPCVRLQCVDFDVALYRDIVAANARFFENGGSATNDRAPNVKRRKVGESSKDVRDQGDDSSDDEPLSARMHAKSMFEGASSTGTGLR